MVKSHRIFTSQLLPSEFLIARKIPYGHPVRYNEGLLYRPSHKSRLNVLRYRTERAPRLLDNTDRGWPNI